MHKYTVLDTTADGKLLALRDSTKRYHVARIGSSVPPFGAQLEGPTPATGYALLTDAPAGAAYRVHFEHIDISQEAILAMIHPVSEEFARPALRWSDAIWPRCELART